MKLNEFLDIIDPERTMMLTDQIFKNRRHVCDRRQNVKAKCLFNFVSSIHLDSSLKTREEDLLRKEIISIPWNYIQRQGVGKTDSRYIEFEQEDYTVWRAKSILSGLCDV